MGSTLLLPRRVPHQMSSRPNRPSLVPGLSALLVVLALSTAPEIGAQQPSEAPKLPDSPRVRLVQIPGSIPEPRPAAVILPERYDQDSSRYPVLYLLHGLGGSWLDWLVRTNVLHYTRDMPLIVVMPDAGDSWYVNSATDPARRFGDYVGTDVVAYTDTHFRTLPYPQARYIAGLSMGGYGALLLATRIPRRFSFAASLSGAFTSIREWDRPSLMSAFGQVGDSARAAADLATLLETADTVGLPYIYLACGTADPFLAGNREVAAILSKRGLPYEYHETHGAHEWEFWDRALRLLLARVAGRIPKEARGH